jgi:hypothetical protein
VSDHASVRSLIAPFYWHCQLTEAADSVSGGATPAVYSALGLALGGGVAGAVLAAGALAGVVVESAKRPQG